jgi:hypothetical protein
MKAKQFSLTKLGDQPMHHQIEKEKKKFKDFHNIKKVEVKLMTTKSMNMKILSTLRFLCLLFIFFYHKRCTKAFF